MGNQFNASWSVAQRETLQRLWNEGLSASRIHRTGALPGKSKNAICGEVWRLRNKGVAMRMIGEKPKPAPKKRVRAKPADKRRLPGFKPPTPIAQTPAVNGGKPLLELLPNGCRFIVSTDDARAPTHLYCGVAVAGMPPGDPPPNCYCDAHAAFLPARGVGH